MSILIKDFSQTGDDTGSTIKHKMSTKAESTKINFDI